MPKKVKEEVKAVAPPPVSIIEEVPVVPVIQGRSSNLGEKL